MQLARRDLAADLVDDLRRADDLLREADRKLGTAVRASGTTLTGIFGVGPVIAATVIGAVRDVARFASRDAFAAYNGTAPIEVSSGKRKACRLSRRGNRNLNHAIHMAAVTQVRHPDSEGRAYYDKKLAEGKTGREALRALKRKVSDASSCGQTLPAPPRTPRAREGKRGTTPSPARPAHTPDASHSRTAKHPAPPALPSGKDQRTAPQQSHKHPLTQRGIDLIAYMVRFALVKGHPERVIMAGSASWHLPTRTTEAGSSVARAPCSCACCRQPASYARSSPGGIAPRTPESSRTRRR